MPLTELVLLGCIAVRSGEYLQWDGPNMRFTNSAPANKLLKPDYQNDWKLEAWTGSSGKFRGHHTQSLAIEYRVPRTRIPELFPPELRIRVDPRPTQSRSTQLQVEKELPQLELSSSLLLITCRGIRKVLQNVVLEEDAPETQAGKDRGIFPHPIIDGSK